jgi:hydrogenase-4 component F
MLLTTLLLVPATAGLLALLARPRWLLEALNVAAFLTTLGLGVALLHRVLDRGVVVEWNEFFYADALSAWMVLLISIVSLGASLYAVRYVRLGLAEGDVSPARFREFYVLTPWFAAGMFPAVLANNLGVMWVAMEGTALASVLLVALYNRKTSLEAAWKYVILGGLGLILALFGTIFTYAAAINQTTHTLPSFNWSRLMTVASQLDPRLIRLAFVFVLVGYGTKAGLAPLHTWLPDAHSEAPAPTSAMLSGVFLKVALYGVLRFHILTSRCLHTGFSGSLLLAFGMFSMFLAGPFILVQTNLKRMLAYSSLEHVGLICTGIALNAPLTILGALLHMGYHALTKPILFFASGNIHQHFHTLETRRIGPGLLQTMPATALLLALAGIAIMGLPPFGLFSSEFIVVAGALGARHPAVAAFVVAALTLVFCGFLRQFAGLLLGNPRPANRPPAARGPGISALILPLGTLLLFSLWMPRPLYRLIVQAAHVFARTP